MKTPASEVVAIFGQATESAPGAARSAFLDQACDGDRLLRQEIEGLISAWEGVGDFLNRSAVAALRARQAESIVDAELPEFHWQRGRSIPTGHVG